MDATKKSVYEFSSKAKALLRNELNAGDRRHGIIELLYQPHFDNEFFLRLVPSENEWRWERVLWDKMADLKKFDVIENLKYIGREILPTIICEEGIVPAARINSIATFFNDIRVPVLLKPDQWLTLDGINITLNIANNNWQTCYSWSVLPEELKQIGKLAELIIQLEAEL